MAVEDEGMYWCKTCGRDIHVGEYEPEGFKNGARDVTNEELVDDDEKANQESNSEMFENLKTFLNSEDGGITTIINWTL